MTDEAVAPLAGSVDRNIVDGLREIASAASLPSRGAWIEMALGMDLGGGGRVAPLAGSVDRNLSE